MGFPDDYRLSGNPQEVNPFERIYIDQQQIAQMGNAWVVQMGQAIVRSIRDVIREEWVADGEPIDVKKWWHTKHPVSPRS